MNDILDRLREAKAEIERLRAGLKYIAENSHDVEACAYAHGLLLGPCEG